LTAVDDLWLLHYFLQTVRQPGSHAANQLATGCCMLLWHFTKREQQLLLLRVKTLGAYKGIGIKLLTTIVKRNKTAQITLYILMLNNSNSNSNTNHIMN